jgi:geranylgeranylglycerol-phosphate geranylgeranyltransferase
MTSERLTAVVQLIRPGNSVFAACAIGIAAVLFGLDADRWVEIIAAGLVGGFIAAGANAVNDYFDLEIDAVNRPERPLPRGALERPHALIVWGVTSACGISLNVFLHWDAFLISLAAVLLLLAYSAWLKRLMVVGNILVALMTGTAFLYAGVVAGHPEKGVVPASFAFLVNLARELVKDAEDLVGDRAHDARTLAVVAGPRAALLGAAGVLVVLMAGTFLPYAARFYGTAYLVLIIPVDLVLAAAAVMAVRRPDRTRLSLTSRLLKLAMVLGLFAIVAGVMRW